MSIPKMASQMMGSAGQVLGTVEKMALGAMIPGGVAIGSVATAALAQIHAGVKVEAKLSFDFPGPFDPVINISCEARLDDGHFRIKEFHLTPHLG